MMKDVTIIAALEMTTIENIHVLGLFPHAKTAVDVGETIGATLPELTDASSGLTIARHVYQQLSDGLETLDIIE